MSLPALLLALLALSPAEMEQQASRHLSLEFERVGRRAPQLDPALQTAARTLAKHALETTATETADLLTITEAVSRAGAWDPSPITLLIRGTPPDEALSSFLARGDLAGEPATHAGVGVAANSTHSALIVLLASRSATLASFPRRVEAGSRHELRGSLADGLKKPELFVTLPSGAVKKTELPVDRSNGFAAELSFASQGQHTVEVLARSERGPQVAALFLVEVGSEGAVKRVRQVEPASLPQARSEVILRINALRASSGLSTLQSSPALDQIATAYAERMAKEGFFAHLSPEGGDLRSRLRAAGYAYKTAGENLGLSSGPLAAHFGIEHSPAHRGTLLEPGYTHVGIGTAQNASNGATLLVEILAAPPQEAKNPLEAAYQAIASTRAAHKLPPLRRHLVLERLALSHAKKALELSLPSSQLPGENLHQEVFDAVEEAASSSVDVVVSEHASQIGESKNLLDRHNSWVGVGVIQGDTLRFGPAKQWVVIIYARAR